MRKGYTMTDQRIKDIAARYYGYGFWQVTSKDIDLSEADMARVNAVMKSFHQTGNVSEEALADQRKHDERAERILARHAGSTREMLRIMLAELRRQLEFGMEPSLEDLALALRDNFVEILAAKNQFANPSNAFVIEIQDRVNADAASRASEAITRDQVRAVLTTVPNAMKALIG